MKVSAQASDRCLAAVSTVARHRIAGPAVILAGAAAVGAFVWFADPTTPGGIIPPCPSNALLHINCPGCGLSRAVYSLLHGDLGAALHFNAVGILALGLLAVLFVKYAVGLWRGRPMRSWFESRYVPVLVVTVLVTWFVIRNIPVEPFMSLKV